MFSGLSCLLTAGFALLPQSPRSRQGAVLQRAAISGVTGGAVGSRKPGFYLVVLCTEATTFTSVSSFAELEGQTMCLGYFIERWRRE